MTMGLGLVASVFISLVPDPSLGLALVTPAMAIVTLAAYVVWRYLAKNS